MLSKVSLYAVALRFTFTETKGASPNHELSQCTYGVSELFVTEITITNYNLKHYHRGESNDL